MTHWTVGKTLQNEKYIIEDIIGEGGFGITYRIKEQKGDRIFALKRLNYITQQQPNFVKLQEDFLNEALFLAKCSHPHIVQVYRVFQEDGLQCMVMEYIEGLNLENHLKNNKILSQNEALKIIRQIGEALTFVHKRGFLHRDVKPANIIIRRHGRDAVLIDFGLAREFTEGQRVTHTNSGTECFAPIEQYELKAERGAYTDVYALAATMYVLRTGKDPYPAKFRKEANVPLVPPKQHNPQIEDWENDAILTGMELNAKDRPQTIKAWLKLLKRDYRRLQSYLEARKWEEADNATANMIITAATKEKKGRLQKEYIDNFPCSDLRTIQRIWAEYTFEPDLSRYKDIWESQRGFSMHKAISQSLRKRQKIAWRRMCYFWLGWVLFLPLLVVAVPASGLTEQQFRDYETLLGVGVWGWVFSPFIYGAFFSRRDG